MQEIIKMISENGIGIVLLGYFLFRDYKFNERLTNALESINTNLAIIHEHIDEMKGDDINEGE